jgi:hypothetical protein
VLSLETDADFAVHVPLCAGAAQAGAKSGMQAGGESYRASGKSFVAKSGYGVEMRRFSCRPPTGG